MRIYLVAGGIKLEDEVNKLSTYAKYRLTSFHYYSRKAFNTICRLSKRDPEYKIFLDSGAYSAFTQGAEIDLDAYIVFIKKYERFLSIYANLDVIGDEHATLQNQQKMEEAGLSPIPTYHQGEPLSVLREFVKNYEYIALGGMVGLSPVTAKLHLDKCFDIICDNHGNPKTKVHGFGITSYSLLMRYPWYSTDSTAWILTAGMGSIMMANNGDYSKAPLKIAVSENNPKKSDFGRHIDSFNPEKRKMVEDYLQGLGYSIEIARTIRNDRCLINAHYFAGFEKYLSEHRPKHKKHSTLFELEV